MRLSVVMILPTNSSPNSSPDHAQAEPNCHIRALRGHRSERPQRTGQFEPCTALQHTIHIDGVHSFTRGEYDVFLLPRHSLTGYYIAFLFS